MYPANRDQTQARGVFFLAVSQTEDAKDGWYLYWWDAVAHWGNANDQVDKPGDVADYPAIGIDPFGFHETNSVGQPGHNYKHVAFFSADKAIKGVPGTAGISIFAKPGRDAGLDGNASSAPRCRGPCLLCEPVPHR